MRSRAVIIGVLTSGLVLYLSAVASAAQLSHPQTDDQIQTRVERTLANLNLRLVSVVVHQGKVTLEGTVSNAWERRQAYQAVLGVEGVRSVLCNLIIPRDASDRVIATDVERRILEYAFYTIFDNIEVHVRDGRVTLTGEVMTDTLVRAMSHTAAQVYGVVEVFNFIQTIPFSLGDDQIRDEIAAVVYGDLSFCIRADPLLAPIHIVVEHGHVKLTGTVDSDVERRVFQMRAAEVLGVVSVENKIRTRRDT
jgi:osmotically-inducible protein OsmY